MSYICSVCGKDFGRDDDAWYWHLEIVHDIYGNIDDNEFNEPFYTANLQKPPD